MARVEAWRRGSIVRWFGRTVAGVVSWIVPRWIVRRTVPRVVRRRRILIMSVPRSIPGRGVMRCRTARRRRRLRMVRRLGRLRFRCLGSRRRSGGRTRWGGRHRRFRSSWAASRARARPRTTGNGGTAGITRIDRNRRGRRIDARARTRRRSARRIGLGQVLVRIVRGLPALTWLGRRDPAHDFVGFARRRVVDDAHRDRRVVGLAGRRRLRGYPCCCAQESRGEKQLPITTHAMVAP